MNEIEVVENWLHDVLVADSTLNGIVAGRVTKYAAKQNTASPYIIYGLQAASDVQGLGTVRLLTRPLYFVKAVKKDGFPDSTFNIVTNRIDEVVGKAVRGSKTSSDGLTTYVISGRRVQPISYTEPNPTSEIPIFHVGGLYRLEVSKSGA